MQDIHLTQSRNLTPEKLKLIASMLKAMFHPVRIQIIELLEKNTRLNVQEIALNLNEDIEQSLLSHHLIKMKDKGLLSCVREGQYVYYTLRIKNVSNMLDCMNNCCENKIV